MRTAQIGPDLRLSYDIWVTDQAWRQGGWILAVFWGDFLGRDEVEIYNKANNKEANIQPFWPSNIRTKENFRLEITTWVIPNVKIGHLASSQ